MATPTWFTWALLSAVFAALTAIFAKAGLQSINPDFATLMRTAMILGVLGALVAGTGQWQDPAAIPARTWGFLALSALATGASWVCYFRALQMGQAAQVAAVDKLGLVLVAVFAVVFLRERPDGREWLGIALVATGVLLLGFKR